MTREEEKMFEKAAILSMIATIIVFAVTYFQKPETKPVQITHIVKAGDTLWDIAYDARQAYGDPRDIRVIIDQIREVNSSTPYIRPGQELTIHLEATSGF